MPRYIEDIVANHQEAQRRRLAGLPIWEKTIDLRPLGLPDAEIQSPEEAVRLAHGFAKAFRAALPEGKFDITHPDFDSELEEMIEDLETLTIDSFNDAEDYTLLQHVDGRLDDLYDWADKNRVWLETRPSVKRLQSDAEIENEPTVARPAH